MDSELPQCERRATLLQVILSWPVLLMIGWLIWEVTTQASLGVVVLCLKFGVEDFRTAWWLRRRDPDSKRGRTCFWLFLSSALWKVAITAGIIMFALALIGPAFFQAGQMQALLGPFAEAALTTGFGFLASSLMTTWAVARGLWLRQKLWVDARLGEARREDAWPPPDGPYRRVNKTGRLIISSCVALVLPLCIGCIVIIAPPRNDSPASLWVFMVTILFVLPVVVLLLRDYLQRRLFARFPSECWSAAPQEHVADDTTFFASQTETGNGYYADT